MNEENYYIKAKTTYASAHILHSAFLCRLSGYIECLNKIEFNKYSIAHSAFASNAIFSAVSFLEAFINETIDEIISKDIKMKKININEVQNWWNSNHRISTLKKYQKILELSDEDLFNKGSMPYQDVKLALNVRNFLIHFKPEEAISIFDENFNVIEMKDKLIDKIRGKFKIVEQIPPGNPFFPDKCIGYGCAKWVIDSIIEFVDVFLDRLNIKTNHKNIKYKLNTNIKENIQQEKIISFLKMSMNKDFLHYF